MENISVVEEVDVQGVIPHCLVRNCTSSGQFAHQSLCMLETLRQLGVFLDIGRIDIEDHFLFGEAVGVEEDLFFCVDDEL